MGTKLKIFIILSLTLFSFSAKAAKPCYIMDGSPYFIKLSEDHEHKFNPEKLTLKFKVALSDFVDQVIACGDIAEARRINDNKNIFSIERLILNGHETSVSKLKKKDDEFSFELELQPGINRLEIIARDGLGMPAEFENGSNRFIFWAGNRTIKVKAVGDNKKPVQGANIELLLKTENLDIKQHAVTDKNGIGEFSNIPEYDDHIKKGVIFIVAQKNGNLGNAVLENGNNVDIIIKGFKTPETKNNNSSKASTDKNNCKNCQKKNKRKEK